MSTLLRRKSAMVQKIAERIIILNKHVRGILNRMYFIKKAQSSSDDGLPKNILHEKKLEVPIKFIVKRFPIVDILNNQEQLAEINNMKNEILKGLSSYYETFIAVVELKDNFLELMGDLNSSGMKFDIGVNYHLTSKFLELFTNFTTVFIMMGRIEDRKAILSLYAHAFDMVHSKTESNYPRMSQIIVDYEDPIKKLSEDFNAYSKPINAAVVSLIPIYQQRRNNSDTWRNDGLFSISSHPAQMADSIRSAKVQCEYLGLESLEKWIYFGYLLCHNSMANNQNAQMSLWKPLLQSNFCLSLIREEVIMIHKTAEEFFTANKASSKKIAEIKQQRDHAVEHLATTHCKNREFLRTAMKDLICIISDEPGLLGPKALFVFISLSYARDEINFLLRTSNNLIKKSTVEEFTDDDLGELLFYMEELRSLVRRHIRVIQKYYVQYMFGYDSPVLKAIMMDLSVCPEDESVILTSFVKELGSLSVTKVDNRELFNFDHIRLDCCRLQAYTSVHKAALNLMENRELAYLLNNIAYHTRCVDDLEGLLSETADLSIFCFYEKNLIAAFRKSMEKQVNYSVACPLICGHFIHATSDFCPEERGELRDKTVELTEKFLQSIATQANNAILEIISHEVMLSQEQLAPSVAALAVNRQEGSKTKKKRDVVQLSDRIKPGLDSIRVNVANISKNDMRHRKLVDTTNALEYCDTIKVWDQEYSPREYFLLQLQASLSKLIVKAAIEKDEKMRPPSVLLQKMKSLMSVVLTLKNYMKINTKELILNLFQQQTALVDERGRKTITGFYSEWYDSVLGVATDGHHVFSEQRRNFVNTSNTDARIDAEVFTNISELRALAELIGPFGMIQIQERLVGHVFQQVKEIKILVEKNHAVLVTLRTNFDKPRIMAGLFNRLEGTESLLLRLAIIGVVLSFSDVCRQALNQVLEQSIPFLMDSIEDFTKDIALEFKVANKINELSSAAGFKCDVNPNLCKFIESLQLENDHYDFGALLNVFIAVSIPHLASDSKSLFDTRLVGHGNNCHTIARAINTVSSAVFAIQRADANERMKEFLALTSTRLMQLGKETKRSNPAKNRESIYLLLKEIVHMSPHLTMDLLESCFPYALLRDSYSAVSRKQPAEAAVVDVDENTE